MPGDNPESSRSAAAAKAQNLARIRDNQRRSRARLMEYLQELEEKYRQCEQVGIEASAEIQAAARHVLDENKRLRELLKRHGLSDAQIDQSAYPENSQYSSAASSLEAMLGMRRPCGSCNSASGSSEAGSRKQSSSSASHAHQQELMVSPETETLPPQSQATTTYHENKAAGSNSLPPITTSSDVPVLSDGKTMQYAIQTEQPLPHQKQLFAEQNNQFNNDFYWGTQYNDQHFVEPITANDPPATGTSSCHTAASAIRTLEPGLGYELEQELGCGPEQDCTVPNAEIFKIMDRYHGGPGL